ncbi:MAG: extra-cytoplasmic solute receptor [Burkholderiales bacterium]|nr:extra-cytoplasmic solute receptor [Burkholderiales bacterium]
MTSRRTLLEATAALACTTLGGFARAQSPAKLARMVVPFPAGGGSDAAARALGERIREHFPGGLIVDNRPGAAGRLGIESVKNAEPDGLTMMFVPDFVLTIYPHSYQRLKYDPLADFTPVAQCARSSYVLAAGPGLPATVADVKQLVAWWKDNPRQALIANNSAGSPTHFAAVMLARSAGVEVTHVSYKGGAPAIQDLLGGQVPVSINPVGEVLPHTKGGRLRVLATTGAQRDRFMLDSPTMAEAGYPDVAAVSWLGVLMPRQAPAEWVQRTAAAIDAAVQRPDLRDAFAGFGMDTTRSTPAAMAAAMRSELDRWGAVVKASGFSAQD